MTKNKTCHLISNYTTADVGVTQTQNSIFSFQQIPPESSQTIGTMTTGTQSTTTTPTSMFSYVIVIPGSLT